MKRHHNIYSSDIKEADAMVKKILSNNSQLEFGYEAKYVKDEKGDPFRFDFKITFNGSTYTKETDIAKYGNFETVGGTSYFVNGNIVRFWNFDSAKEEIEIINEFITPT